MKALIVGAHGQLGRALTAALPQHIEGVGHDFDTLDITDRDRVASLIEAERPDILFNAAAYTAVDKAETDEERALAVNATAVGYLAEAAGAVGARLVHVSTDFVFSGQASRPYSPEAEPRPLSAYGRTKLGGEQAAGPNALIVRTAWVYAPTGGNFVRTMLRLMSDRPEVRVVADQIGTPTYAPDLARALWALTLGGYKGLYHYTDSGVASWYDFAVAIQEEALALGLIAAAVPVVPITTEDFPTPAMRPAYSVLDKRAAFAALGGPAPHWRVNLRRMLEDVRTHG